MHGLMRTLLLAAGLVLGGLAHAQQAQPATPVTPKGPPAGFVAPAEPKPDENNAQRGKTQPGNNAPFWRAVRESGNQQGTTSLPGAEKGMLIQPFVQYPGSRYTTAGEAWRQVRNQWIVPYGGSLILIVVLAIALFYWRKGQLGHAEATGSGGRRIERFTPFERAAHWCNAIAFVVLAVSGLVMAFGKFVLLPVMGATLFGWLTYALKTAHNFAGPLFAVSLVVVFLTFVRDNLPSKAHDLDVAEESAGGMFSAQGSAFAPLQRRREAGVLARWCCWHSACRRGGLWPGARQPHPRPGATLRGEMQVAHMVHADRQRC